MPWKKQQSWGRRQSRKQAALWSWPRSWTSTADYRGVYFDMTEQVKMRFDEAGIGIPSPQRDVHIYEHKAD